MRNERKGVRIIVVKKECGTCKHELLETEKEPCKTCTRISTKSADFYSQWESPEDEKPKINKSCDNCKHEPLSHWEEPCENCVDRMGYNKYWEPKESVWITVEVLERKSDGVIVRSRMAEATIGDRYYFPFTALQHYTPICHPIGTQLHPGDVLWVKRNMLEEYKEPPNKSKPDNTLINHHYETTYNPSWYSDYADDNPIFVCDVEPLGSKITLIDESVDDRIKRLEDTINLWGNIFHDEIEKKVKRTARAKEKQVLRQKRREKRIQIHNERSKLTRLRRSKIK